MSVDVEDWFQVGAFERVIDRADWDGLESRVEANTDAVLALFADAGVAATFFTLGWVAHRFPALIGRIAAAGHEIASHGWDHRRVHTMDAAAFRADLARARAALEDAGGRAMIGYRAPSFSIDGRNPWAHAVLAEEGYRYSSSVAPIAHDHYGWAGAPRYAFRPLSNAELVEVPVTVAQWRGRRLATGGGFLRLLPSALADLSIGQANRDDRPAMFYFHPWEIDPGQPRVRHAPLRSRVRHYARLGGMRGKLERLLARHRWGRRGHRLARVTMPLLSAPVGVREADPRDRRERAAIDAFVRAFGGSLFHLPAWSIAVERGCRRRARFLVAERADGATAGVLPLTDMRSALFGRARVSTGFGVDDGILGPAIEPLAAAAWELAARLGCPSVELRGGTAPAGWAIDDHSYLGFARYIAADPLAAIPRKQRAEVRRSLGNGLEIVVGRDPAALAEHYRVYAESVRNLGTPFFPRALFAEVIGAMDADILSVRHQGRAVASVLSLYHAGTVYPYWGGGTAAARGLRANDRMYLALMEHARDRGMTRFDFDRSKTGSSAAAFKKNWVFAGTPLRYARRRRPGTGDQPAVALLSPDGGRLETAAAADRDGGGAVAVTGTRMTDILFLAHRAPSAPDRGDRIRSFHVLKHLSARARVHVVTFDEGAAPWPDLLLAGWTVVPRTRSRAAATAVALAAGIPVSLAAFADPALTAAVARVPHDVVYCLSGQMAQHVPAAPPFVTDFVDVDSAKFAQLAATRRGPAAWLYAREARLLARVERRRRSRPRQPARQRGGGGAVSHRRRRRPRRGDRQRHRRGLVRSRSRGARSASGGAGAAGRVHRPDGLPAQRRRVPLVRPRGTAEVARCPVRDRRPCPDRGDARARRSARDRNRRGRRHPLLDRRRGGLRRAAVARARRSEQGSGSDGQGSPGAGHAAGGGGDRSWRHHPRRRARGLRRRARHVARPARRRRRPGARAGARPLRLVRPAGAAG